ncbi:unnamed protein product [Chironomus riparius]|uniref:CHK kinase-like domain-containing protein n=1 Tax=Chironomus riparius TaxID=315576 RepID=A0A9P0IZG2_9DIPT|nr:unnamed protein product [Chironomus riparius]
MSHKSDALHEKFKTLPNKIYEENLKELIKQKLNLSCDEYEIRYSEGSSKGDNYIGIIYRAEEQKGISSKHDGFHEVPLCYKTLTVEPFEGLYIEDLKVKGFEVYDRNKELTKEHVMLVMEVLAKMHAIFYCMKEQEPDLIDVYKKRNDYFIMRCERKGSLMSSWYEDSRDQALEVVEKCGNSELIKKVRALLSEDILSLFKSCLNLDMTEPYATLCHGDCWNNNMMFRNDQSGNPISVKFLDWQIMRYSSPILDIMYYIFSCTVKSLRDKHYQEFINFYYDSLSRFIVRLGSDPEKLFPRHAFDDHLKKFGKFGLIMGVLVLPVFTSDVDEVPDMDEFVSNLNEVESTNEEDNNEAVSKGVCYVTTKTYPIYAERLLGVCEDLYNFGYL